MEYEAVIISCKKMVDLYNLHSTYQYIRGCIYVGKNLTWEDELDYQ